jgi:hypothetical protein
MVVAETQDAVPGLSAVVSYGALYAFDGIPPGNFEIRAALELDGTAIDPDASMTGDRPQVTVTGTSTADIDLPTVPEVAIVSPTIASSTVSATPDFEWRPVPEARFYVLEVSNVLGQVIWGGFDFRRNPTMRLQAPASSLRFGSLAPPLQQLAAGKLYRWRVYAAIETSTGLLYDVIAASEVDAGQFRVR